MATRIKVRTEKKRSEKDTRPRAVAKYVRVSPRKAKAVIDLIRGVTVPDAKAILMGTPRGAVEPITKLLDSAVANAENTHEIPAEDLYVAECFADQGPTLKRYRPRAKGRATRIRKRTSHITIILDRIEQEDK